MKREEKRKEKPAGEFERTEQKWLGIQAEKKKMKR